MKKHERRRVKERKYHYTYIITDNIHNKFYYGVHSTDYDPEDIRQYSSSSKHLNHAIKCFGIENFSKVVRRYFTTREEASLWEHKVLRRMKVRTRKDFYNQSEGGVGFASEGFVSVRSLVDGKNLRVPVDDPYIGIFYEHVGKGVPCKPHVKKYLSELHKGKWSGDKNPVHKMKDDPEWRLKVSRGNEGKTLSEDCIAHLKTPEHLEHLRSLTDITDEGLYRKYVVTTYNNSKHKWVYFYKGKVYLYPEDVPDFKSTSSISRSPSIVVMEIPHPKVPILVAGGKLYQSVKDVSQSLGIHTNTVVNRVKSTFRKDYYYLSEDIIKESRQDINRRFIEALEESYKDLLLQQAEFEKPFSLGMSNVDATNIFMDTGRFLEGTTFERLKYKDMNGCYSWYEVTCPLCSNDEYVSAGVCNGRFKGKYGCLKLGGQPCRCGDPKNYALDIYIYHIIDICEREGIEFIGVSKVAGNYETKIEWKCKRGAIHKNTSVGLFLEKGSRCRCCRTYYKNNPPEKLKLSEVLKHRKISYTEQEANK